jgi:hypothetical protein
MPVTEGLDLLRELAETSGDWPIRKLLSNGAHEFSTLVGLQSCERVPLQSPRRAIDKLVPTAPRRLGVGPGEDPHHPPRLAHGEGISSGEPAQGEPPHALLPHP